MLFASAPFWLVDAGRSLREGFFMFWETLWPLILGFGLSGVVQAFVTREAMQRKLGDHRPRTIARASGYGMISSSCSYAATAMSKSLFVKGADFLSTLVFMFASTNLVLELGIVLVVLMGWQFAASEFVGGVIMIVLLASLGGLWLRGRVVDQARAHLIASDSSGAGAHGSSHDHSPATEPMEHIEHIGAIEHAATMPDSALTRRWRTKSGWADAATYTMADLTMLRRELAIGYLVAGVLATTVPVRAWNVLFLHGHGLWTTLENVVVGPFIAIISFVCSIGNVPLAAALWHGGIAFGGVVSFIFADLITLPLLLIYRRYYGTRVTLRLLGLFWLVMSLAGLATEVIFRGFGLVPTTRPAIVAPAHFSWNYTTYLNLVFLVVFALLVYAYRHQHAWGGGAGYAIDPVCSMQVEIANAPASLLHEGRTVFFCSDHCRHRFAAEPARYFRRHDVPATTSDAATDPVCGMSVVPHEAAATRVLNGVTYYFCATNCAERFAAEPQRYLDSGPVAMSGAGPVALTLRLKPVVRLLETDPVCGMTVAPHEAAATREFEGVTYYFCATNCAERFDAEPSAFVP